MIKKVKTFDALWAYTHWITTGMSKDPNHEGLREKAFESILGIYAYQGSEGKSKLIKELAKHLSTQDSKLGLVVESTMLILRDPIKRLDAGKGLKEQFIVDLLIEISKKDVLMVGFVKKYLKSIFDDKSYKLRSYISWFLHGYRYAAQDSHPDTRNFYVGFLTQMILQLENSSDKAFVLSETLDENKQLFWTVYEKIYEAEKNKCLGQLVVMSVTEKDRDIPGIIQDRMDLGARCIQLLTCYGASSQESALNVARAIVYIANLTSSNIFEYIKTAWSAMVIKNLDREKLLRICQRIDEVGSLKFCVNEKILDDYFLKS